VRAISFKAELAYESALCSSHAFAHFSAVLTASSPPLFPTAGGRLMEELWLSSPNGRVTFTAFNPFLVPWLFTGSAAQYVTLSSLAKRFFSYSFVILR
jgi:hypothetical protein